jgi:hypothetical protein
MRRRTLAWTLAVLAISCGKTRELGSGQDGPGGSDGKAPAQSAGGGAAPNGAISAGGAFVGSVLTGGRPGSGGEAGDAGVEPFGGEGGSAPAGGGEAGGMPSAASGSNGDGGETEPCGPLDVEFIEPSELDTSSWVSEEQCDSEARDVAKSFASYDGGPEIDAGKLSGKWADGSNSTRIELILDEAGTSTLKFGDAPVPELDVEAAYLTGVEPRDVAGAETYGFLIPLIRGFAYTLLSSSWLGDEMNFTFRRTEPWDGWCAAQTPLRGAYCYSCVPGGSRRAWRDDTCGELQGCFTFEELARQVRVDCGREALCNRGVCWCSKDGCRSDPTKLDFGSVTVDPTDPDVIRIDRDAFGDATRYLRRE